MRSRQPNGARAASVEGVGALRQRALHPSPQRRALRKGWRLLSRPPGQPGQLHGFGVQGEFARVRFPTGPAGPYRPGATRCPPKLHLNGGLAAWTAFGAPQVTAFAPLDSSRARPPTHW